MTTTERITAAIEAYLRRTGMSARSFGKEAIGDQNLVYHLRAGKRGLTSTSIDRIEEFMRDRPASKKKKADETRTAA